jgi:hypothetical protein
MKKILIICFYELKDFFNNIRDEFEHYHYDVYHFPLFRYAYDSHDKMVDYKEFMSTFIKNLNPDIILWWFIDVSSNVIKYVKQNNPQCYYIMYNADDPLNISHELYEKAKYFDLVSVPCKENLLKYKIISNVKSVLFLPMGYDSSLLNKTTEYEKEIFQCDISMVINNLYLDKRYYPNQYIYHFDLITSIVEHAKLKKYKFHLYGHPILNSYFPDNYKGELSYHKEPILFNQSKINITLHPFCNKSMSINEFVLKILGNGGLLMVDPIRDLNKFLPDNSCIYLKQNEYCDQIDEILTNYDNYKSYKINGQQFAKNYDWKNWVTKIHIEYSRQKFDPLFYQKVYNIDELNTYNELFEYWLSTGIKNKEICYNISVPSVFKYEDYSKNNNLINKDKTYIYLHWRIHSKDDIYMKQSKSISNFSSEGATISSDKLVDLFSVFSDIYNDTRVNSLDGFSKLKIFLEQTPFVNINTCLEHYFSFIE